MSAFTNRIALLKQELARLEQELAHAPRSGNDAPCDPIPSLALMPALPSGDELNRRLKIRFAERVQDAAATHIVRAGLGDIIAQQAGAGAPPVLPDVSGIGEVNVNVNLPAPGDTRQVTGIREELPCGRTTTRVIRVPGEAYEGFWSNQDEATIPGLKDRVKAKAEKDATTKAVDAAKAQVADRYLCGGRCEQGQCPSEPSVTYGDPTIVASEAIYDDSSPFGSEINATATARIEIFLNCQCQSIPSDN